jgi:hypothetical protein
MVIQSACRLCPAAYAAALYRTHTITERRKLVHWSTQIQPLLSKCNANGSALLIPTQFDLDREPAFTSI